ncbi:hypothetical protein HYS95_02980 [Candidatus Daviesbacteria bacterium]|nr:hypothetical protein [Candidatus Daviesbacteria bacterium]
MFEREQEIPLPYSWEGIIWEEAPYERVFLKILREKIDPVGSSIPRFTLMALKVLPGGSIPLHLHTREAGWTETLTFPAGSQFTVLRDDSEEQIIAESRMTLTIAAEEVFGIRNDDSVRTLFFTSLMRPGFTGYEEIKAA